jgi:hypothetical protein
MAHELRMCVVFFFGDRTFYVAQVDLELEILLPQPLKCWDYRYPDNMFTLNQGNAN